MVDIQGIWLIYKKYGWYTRNMVDKTEIWLIYKEWLINKKYGWYKGKMVDKQGIWWINKKYGWYTRNMVDKQEIWLIYKEDDSRQEIRRIHMLPGKNGSFWFLIEEVAWASIALILLIALTYNKKRNI